MTIVRRKTASGKTRYGVRTKRDGQVVWHGTFDSLPEAKREDAKQSKVRTSLRTADAYTDFFLEGYRERVKASTYDTTESALLGFKRDFRAIPLSRISPTEAERWARENRWRVPAVVTVLNDAVRRREIDHNPFAGLSRKGQGRKHLTPLTQQEVDRLADLANRIHGPNLRALVYVLAYTGIRPGEAFALDWTDVRLEDKRLHISKRLYRGVMDLPKSNRARPVVLPAPARDALVSLERSDPVFKGKRGGRLSQTMLTWYWAPVTAAFERKVQPYELRHFAAHYLYVQMGLKDYVVAEQLGHQDGGFEVRNRYGHPGVGALEEIDKAFDNVVPLRREEAG